MTRCRYFFTDESKPINRVRIEHCSSYARLFVVIRVSFLTALLPRLYGAWSTCTSKALSTTMFPPPVFGCVRNYSLSVLHLFGVSPLGSQVEDEIHEHAFRTHKHCRVPVLEPSPGDVIARVELRCRLQLTRLPYCRSMVVPD